MRLQEDSARKQEAERRAVAEQIEAERRATEQYKASLDKEVQAARALAEAEGRIKENRANEDINRRRAARARAVELIPDHDHAAIPVHATSSDEEQML